MSGQRCLLLFLLFIALVHTQAFSCVDLQQEVNALINEQHFGEAQALAEMRLEESPEDIQRHLEMATVYGARAFLEKTPASRREEIPAYEVYGKGLDDFHRYFTRRSYDEPWFEKAIEQHRKTTRRWPGHKKAWLCILDLYQAAGRDREMLATVDEIMEIYAGNKRSFIPNFIPFAASMIKKKEMKRSAAYLRHLIGHFPESVPLLTSYAFISLHEGEIDVAIENYIKAYEVDRSNTAALQNLGMAYVIKQDFDKAESVYTKLAETEPGSTSARFQLAILAMRKSDAEALEAWEQYFKAHKNNPDSDDWVKVATTIRDDLKEGMTSSKKLELSREFARLGLNHMSLPLLVNLFAEDPANHEYALTLAQLYENARIPLKSYEYGKKALSIVEQNPDKHNNEIRAGINYETGRLALELGRYEESRGFLEKAIELNPGQSNVQYMLGHVYRSLGNNDRAVELFRQCTEKKNNIRYLTECQEMIRILTGKPDNSVNRANN